MTWQFRVSRIALGLRLPLTLAVCQRIRSKLDNFSAYIPAEKDPLDRIYLALCRTFREHFRTRPFAAINGPKSLFQNGKMKNFSQVSK